MEQASLKELHVPPGWITTRDAAQKAGKAINTIRDRIYKGKVQARKLGGQWIIEESSLEEMR